jgi:hypothetical protein
MTVGEKFDLLLQEKKIPDNLPHSQRIFIIPRRFVGEGGCTTPHSPEPYAR